MQKIILSRKGFDSASGGYPNVIMPDGRLISFPIPDSEVTGIKYKDLFIDKDLSYYDLMQQLGMKEVYDHYVHLDPDIYPFCKKRDSNWNAMFGQVGGAQTHLGNHDVNIDDVFLYFGWFRKVKKTNNGYQYIKGTDKHIIYGYLQVGDIINIDTNCNSYPKWMMTHPHFYRTCPQGKNNTAYIARKKLNFNQSLNGYGVFNYHDSLILTKENCNKSVWKLPVFFHPTYNTIMTFHSNPKLWSLNKNHCELKTVGRGQEFVVKNSQEVIKWAKDLISNNKYQ